jgi:membrane fusion protein (multidrug efflux system)
MRYVYAGLGLLLIIGALVGVKFTQISGLIKMGKQMEKAGPPPETVSTALSRDQSWEGTLTAVGSIAAAKGVAISNDAPGVVARIQFESGALVKQGQVLLTLDTRVESAQLASARARRDFAVLSLNRSRVLLASNTIAQAQVDTDESQLKTTTADVGALEAQIDRKIVRAPFAGRLGIRAVNLGQYLNPGTTLTVLEAIDSVYVDFSLPQQRLANLTVGMPVRVTLESDQGPPADGTIAAIDPTIDATTRTIKVRATMPNKSEKLRPGMFANVTVVLPQQASLIVVPATAIVHASFGDSVFVVEDAPRDPAPAAGAVAIKMARQQFVKLGEARGDFVAIVDGVKAGQEVVTAGAFKLRNGSKVIINNDLKQDPQLAPHPVNR